MGTSIIFYSHSCWNTLQTETTLRFSFAALQLQLWRWQHRQGCQGRCEDRWNVCNCMLIATESVYSRVCVCVLRLTVLFCMVWTGRRGAVMFQHVNVRIHLMMCVCALASTRETFQYIFYMCVAVCLRVCACKVRARVRGDGTVQLPTSG